MKRLRYSFLCATLMGLHACASGALTVDELPENMTTVSGKQATVMGHFCKVEEQQYLVAGFSCAFPLPDIKLLLVFDGTSRLDAKRLEHGCQVSLSGTMVTPANAAPAAVGTIPSGSTLRVRKVISYDGENCIE